MSSKTWLALSTLIFLTGCATQRTVTITTRPPDATIKIRGVEVGRGTVTERIIFTDEGAPVPITASRKGFQDRTISITPATAREELRIDLKPHVRRISVAANPAAIISVDGVAITPEPVSAFSTDVEFTVDQNDNWINHRITAEREGFVKAEQTVTWTDPQSIYTLKLDPMRKDVRITSNPPGAVIAIDGEELGVSPASVANKTFDYDTLSNRWVDKVVRVTKPGYDPAEFKIAWDNGRTDYEFDLVPKQKNVVLKTDPAGATVVVEGQTVKKQGDAYVIPLTYKPLNDRGDLPKFKARVTHKAGDTEYHPGEIEFPWDGGKTDYTLKLREVLSVPMDETQSVFVSGENGWSLTPKTAKVIAMKFTNEPDGAQPQQIVKLRPGETIGSLSVSPDGQFLVYTVQTQKGSQLASQMFRTRTDGQGGTTTLSDGRSTDLTPAYTAAGDRIVFSSNRAGRRFQIHGMSATGEGGVTQLTTGEASNTAPSVDAEAKPRLFYQAMIDTRPDPRLYVTQIGTNLPTDLTAQGGQTPRISPKNDSLVYMAPDERTAKFEIFRVSDRGGAPENLTNSDADDRDPTWNFSGGQIAFASDRNKDGEDNRNNFDLYVLDLANGGQPKQITRNGSVDDLPAFDPAGDALYFRSNRGGTWGIWKLKTE